MHAVSSAATIFQSYGFNSVAASVFSEREAPLVVAVEEGSAAAIIPGAIASGHCTLLGETLFDYRAPLGSGPASELPAILRTAWSVFFQEQEKDAGLPFAVTAARHSSPQLWPGCTPEPFANAPFIRAGQASLRSSSLRAQLRRLLDAGCRLTVHPGADSSLVRSIYEWKASQPSGELFRDALRIEAVTQMARIARSAGHKFSEDHSENDACQIYLLERRTSLVAALVTFRDRQWRRFYSTCYHPDWASYSPGSALLEHVIAQSLAAGLDCDLMTGEQPFKLRFANGSAPLFRMTAPRRTARLAAPATSAADSRLAIIAA